MNIVIFSIEGFIIKFLEITKFLWFQYYLVFINLQYTHFQSIIIQNNMIFKFKYLIYRIL